MITKRTLLIGMPLWIIKEPPLALAYVAGMFRQSGWQCDVADYNIALYRYIASSEGNMSERYGHESHLWASQKLDALIQRYGPYLYALLNARLRNAHYDLIAFSVRESNLGFSICASKYVKALYPDIPILFGGVSCYPSNSGLALLREVGGPDIICQGEAEVALPNFLREIATTGNYRTATKGFAVRDGDQVVDNGEPDLPCLGTGDYQPDWTALDLRQYGAVGQLPIIASKGCVNRCTFCTECIMMKKYRCRTPADIVAEMRTAVPLLDGFTDKPHFHIVDSLLNGNIRQLDGLCDAIVASGLQIGWSGMAKFRPEMTNSLLRKMRLAGCERLFWGLESASQHHRLYEEEVYLKLCSADFERHVRLGN